MRNLLFLSSTRKFLFSYKKIYNFCIIYPINYYINIHLSFDFVSMLFSLVLLHFRLNKMWGRKVQYDIRMSTERLEIFGNIYHNNTIVWMRFKHDIIYTNFSIINFNPNSATIGIIAILLSSKPFARLNL